MTTSREEVAKQTELTEMYSRVNQLFYTSKHAPVRTTTQAEHVLDRLYGGQTAAMAAAYNMSPRTIRRWLDGSRTPQGANAARLLREATAAQTTKRGRERRARQAEQHRGDVLVPRVNNFTVRGSDAVRPRDISISLSGTQLAALALAENESQVDDVIQEGLAAYFNGGTAGGFHPGDFGYDAGSLVFNVPLMTGSSRTAQ
ncbi:hypothetical protein [Streptomyces sp. WM6378]|uniref:hypothetical protein n=1 Tax=Streptomyces sp. WM6378 TaxID=1415557 RepID=UPI0006AED92F|nr:hypothetical protein [Streptomyces sp. WM6378]KOU43238.1 hypothetical protein ADK54_18200 [Streptomyces sp. WM6378]